MLTASLHIAEAAPSLPGPSPVNSTDQEQLAHGLFIDRLLEDSSSEAVLYDEFSILKVGHYFNWLY